MQRILEPFITRSQSLANPSLLLVNAGWQYRTLSQTAYNQHRFPSSSSGSTSSSISHDRSHSRSSTSSSTGSSYTPHPPGRSPSPSQKSSKQPNHPPSGWDDNPEHDVQSVSDLPSSNFGKNQHIPIDKEFEEALRQILRQFRAPIRSAFAYGSGVFPQSSFGPSSPSVIHPNPDPAITRVQKGNGKVIDFIFGVSHTQHWHSLNLNQHRNHYSAIGTLGSYAVSQVQDKWGAGVYFNPYVTVNGTLIKYGVVNIDTLCRDMLEWNTLYVAGRLHKPVKILKDEAKILFANQHNLYSAVRTALLLLPATFTEQELYKTITGISYLGDPRMSLGGENLNKVANIVKHQKSQFRHLYTAVINELPNVSFQDARYISPSWADDPDTNLNLEQDMDPIKRGNMVQRLPKNFREKLYFRYQSKYQIPQLEFNKMMEQSNDEDPTRIRRRQGGPFDQRITKEEQVSLNKEVSEAIAQIIKLPSITQSLKGIVTSGVRRSWRYLIEKWGKYRQGQKVEKEKER